MPEKWKLLPIGTKIILEGEKYERTIVEYFTDEGVIKGYIAKREDGSPAIIAPDDPFKVLKK